VPISQSELAHRRNIRRYKQELSFTPAGTRRCSCCWRRSEPRRHAASVAAPTLSAGWRHQPSRTLGLERPGRPRTSPSYPGDRRAADSRPNIKRHHVSISCESPRATRLFQGPLFSQQAEHRLVHEFAIRLKLVSTQRSLMREPSRRNRPTDRSLSGFVCARTRQKASLPAKARSRTAAIASRAKP
jgi:hypothetical protein